MAEDEKPDVQWDEALIASTDFHELARYTRDDETRIYNLRVVAGGAELWRLTEVVGQQTVSVKECAFRDADAAGRFLEEVRRTLRAGGWRQTM